MKTTNKTRTVRRNDWAIDRTEPIEMTYSHCGAIKVIRGTIEVGSVTSFVMAASWEHAGILRDGLRDGRIRIEGVDPERFTEPGTLICGVSP